MEKQPEEEEEEEEEEEHSLTLTLALFDFYWSRSSILRASPPPPLPPPPPPPPPPPATLLDRRSRHRRSSSEEIPPSLRSLRIQVPKLQTILSGKVSELERQHVPRSTLRVRKKRRNSCSNCAESTSKSMSDLEFEELKGFMDLGFTFSEADPRLMTIVPGLQRLKFGSAADVVVPAPSDWDQEPAVSRPYLSEAWDVSEEEEDPLRNWRIPAVREGVDLKDHLRFWAHTVASTVR